MNEEQETVQEPIANPKKGGFVRNLKKAGCLTAVVLLLIGVGWFYFHFYFVFGNGVKAGELNYVVNKGYLFKTNEGKLIQAGFKGNGMGVGTSLVQSNEFVFSVEDQAVADSLMRCSSKTVELHYKEYKGALPWRGMSRYVVDSIVSVH